MSRFVVRPAKRENVWLLLGFAGGTGGGKTFTAMRVASGLTGGKRFGVVDTENGRASHYADDFSFDVVDLHDPFTPDRYQQAIQALVEAGHKVIVVDSMSHEWEGIGGLLEWHEKEMGGKEANNLRAWIKPKMAHRKLVAYLLQVPAHIILCFRAAERVETERGADGKLRIVPKKSLTGLDGWIPITEKALPFELTASFLLTADKPGHPKPIKLQQQHKALVPLDEPVTEATGAALARWARGADSPDLEQMRTDLVKEILALSSKPDEARKAIDKHHGEQEIGAHIAWLGAQLEKARAAKAAA